MPNSFLDTLGLIVAPPILTVVAASLLALGDVFAKIALGDVSPRMFLTIRWAISAGFYTLLVTALGGWAVFTLDGQALALGIVGGVTGPVIAWTCFSRALQILDVSVASPTRSVSIVLAVALSIVVLHEHVHIGIAIGAALLLSGVYLVQRVPQKKVGVVGYRPQHPDRTKGILLVLAACVLWGATTVIFKLASEAMPVIQAAWFRATVPALVFAGIFAWNRLAPSSLEASRTKPFRIGTPALLAIVASGLTTDLIGWTLRFAAYRSGDLVVLAPLEQTGPIWIAVFASVLLKERMPLDKIVGIALVVVGAIAITWPA